MLKRWLYFYSRSMDSVEVLYFYSRRGIVCYVLYDRISLRNLVVFLHGHFTHEYLRCMFGIVLSYVLNTYDGHEQSGRTLTWIQ